MYSKCRVLWTARRSNQPILKEINPEYSLEGLMLKLQYSGHLIWRADSTGKTPMLGKIEGRRRSEWQRMMAAWHHWHNGHEFEQIPGDSEGQGSLVCCSGITKESDVSDWTTKNSEKGFFQITVLKEVLETEKGKWPKLIGHSRESFSFFLPSNKSKQGQ